jgi:hypothetical protein
MFDAPNWAPVGIETIPGAWPAPINEGETLQRGRPYGVMTLAAIMEESPCFSEDILTTSEALFRKPWGCSTVASIFTRLPICS